MNPILSRLQKIPVAVQALAVGGGFAAALSLALAAPGRGPGTRPTAPPRPAVMPQPRPESRPVAGPVTLASLAIGPEPRVLTPGRSVVATFVTDDSESCRVVATARLAPGAGTALIRWTVAAPAGFELPADGRWTGARLAIVLRRPGGNPAGLGGPLALTVQARVQVNGQEYTARETVVQDELDQLRQEYIDLERHQVPDRSEFLDTAAFESHYSRRYPWLSFADLNWSVNPATGLRYAYALIQPELVEGLDQVRRAYGGVVINSGYRNPVRQLEVHAPVRESLHQYGYAADLAVTPGDGRGLPNEVDWRRLAEVACAARAKWVEPLASSAPNSPGCHVHLDYRPGAASSAPVRLHGQVVAGDTGRPVAGALVLLGAMPARTDANGFFGIRNVLSGGEHPVEVHAEGFETLVQPVRLAAWGTASARLAVYPEARPTVSVELARTEWMDRHSRLFGVTLRVANTSGLEADDLRLGVAPAGATLVSLEPTLLGSLPAGAVRGATAVVRLRRGGAAAPVPLAVSFAFRRPSGSQESVQIQLMAAPPGVAAAVTATAAGPPAKAAPKPKPARGTPVAAPTAAPPRPSAPKTSAPVKSAPAPLQPLKPSGSAAEPAKPKDPTPAGDPKKEPEPPSPPADTPATPPGAAPPPPAAGETQPPAAPAPGEGKPSGGTEQPGGSATG